MIINLRMETGLSRKDFAEVVGIPIRTIEDWEAGRRNPPEYVLRMLAYYVRGRLKKEKVIPKEKSEARNVIIITDIDGRKIVLINDKKFRGMNKADWKEIEEYLTQYIGEYFEIAESSEKIFIDKDFPDEYANSKERIGLKGANKKAKANASQGIPELIQIATKPKWEKNREKKHNADAKKGWYRYEVRFALPIYNDDGELVRYNIFSAKMLVRYAEDDKKYLYDLQAIKKENERPV